MTGGMILDSQMKFGTCWAKDLEKIEGLTKFSMIPHLRAHLLAKMMKSGWHKFTRFLTRKKYHCGEKVILSQGPKLTTATEEVEHQDPDRTSYR